MSKISFIYFDVGGVFLNWDHYFETVANTFHIELSILRTYFDKYSDAITLGDMTSGQLWKVICQELSIEGGDRFDFLKAWASDYLAIPETADFAKLVANTYPVGIISDIYKGMFPLLLEKNIVPNLDYSHLVLSCDIHMRKPNREIYEYAQKLSGVNPEEILFIDDSSSSITMASELGWNTHQFDTANPSQSIIALNHILNL